MNRKEQCGSLVIHHEAVQRAETAMLQEKDILRLASFFKVFGDGTRLKILLALSLGELCVCDISVLLDMSQSAISHQLRLLRSEQVVKNRRAGKIVFYSMDDEHIEWILRQGIIHLEHQKEE